MNLPSELTPTDKFMVQLQNGTSVELPICRPVFSVWSGEPPTFDFGGKPLLSYKGEPCFAELIILRLLKEHGWNGVWVEAYGGTHYLQSMPTEWDLNSNHVSIPEDKKALLRRIHDQANTTACFDVFVWDDKHTLFFEAKRSGKDRLTNAQIKFIEGALKCGISSDAMVIVEWTFK